MRSILWAVPATVAATAVVGWLLAWIMSSLTEGYPATPPLKLSDPSASEYLSAGITAWIICVVAGIAAAAVLVAFRLLRGWAPRAMSSVLVVAGAAAVACVLPATFVSVWLGNHAPSPPELGPANILTAVTFFVGLASLIAGSVLLLWPPPRID